ncbi:MAG TPA: OmpA family protein [Bacteroidales bacterium]|nr:OmpA family protein [Bacteroidales bacterium]HBZ22119.1 OmpA family protein [Bacteroidales bacterium]
MKYPVSFSVVFALMMFLFQEADSQVKVDVKGKVNNEADNRANNATDRVIDAGFDKIEDGVKGIFKKKDIKKNNNKESESDADESNPSPENETGTGRSSVPQASLKWNKYDFVPGEKIIFEDAQEGEQNGEFPSRWDLAGGGSAENASFGEQNVIYFKEASTCIVPFLKEPAKDNLPDLFTIEFDCWFEPEEYCQYLVDFWDHKNQSESKIDIDALIINANHAGIHGTGEGYYPGEEEKGEITNGFWRHIAISFNTRALKVYLDDSRVVNIPNLGINPEGLTICCDAMNTVGTEGKNRFIKNIRIAEGAVKLYDKLMSDGKIVTNGIRFDVNKATIKPESMGVINSIYQLLKDHAELNLSVEGHTDSDGDNASNQVLSEKRAQAVVTEITKMGISESRLSSKGWGETKPVGLNNTAEGKAANRRVELVKN